MVKTEVKERLFRWITVPALAAVLATLAVLQYRWSGQVSTATMTQIQSHLETSLLDFRQDLTRELASVSLETRAGLDDLQTNPAQIKEQFRHWQQTAAHPNLIQSIYVWEDPAHQQPLRFDPAQDQLERVQWPAEFGPLQQHLKQASIMMAHSGAPSNRPAEQPRRGSQRYDGQQRFRHDGHMQHHAGSPMMQHHGGPAMGFPFLAVDQSIPALVYPVHRRERPQPGSSPMTWVVIQLNKSVLQKEVFPELAQKYFRGDSGLDYHVAVRDSGNGPDRVIYASDPGFGSDDNVQVDATLNLFGPPFGSAGSSRALELLFTVLPPSGKERSASPDDKRLPGPDRMPRVEVFPHAGEQTVWQIVAKHKSGSVEAAVSALRRRNLIAGFGVLIVLGATMALILIVSQRARRLARLQMDFVAGVSHELRTPLAVISSAAENIAHGVIEDKQQLVRYGNTIVKQARQLNQLVEQVLQFAATQQAPRKQGLGPVNLADVIDAALESTAATVAAAGFTVERQIEAGLPAVSADFGGLVQSLQNLITNAVKYGGENRWLRVAARAIKEKGQASEVELTVEDRGIGISKEEIKHIFEPFYRSPAVAESGIHGTGLGLPLTRNIVEAMGGRLTAESELGKGSAFTIHLQVIEARGLGEPQRATEEPGFSS
jgi:signal transduction histidine kinase